MKPREKNKENFMLYIPIKKHSTYEERKGKIYLMFYHDKFIEKFASKVFKKPKVTDIELDEIGSYVWSIMDSKRNVLEILDMLNSKFPSDSDNMTNRLILFLRYLNRRNWIKFQSNNQ
ncbi:Coenzyme PQQ synthesis protein D (PqqD) [Clostridium cavendishii DSM 21758]|uniref:Coenzyme PQQ synthesis protein D (PqqD) n=1 Tax=Clostridium cavendishii DSM 21758 TaxID=1121302 RepID=A0A1M6UFJ4_9CLOT|nr:PqqD family protein [Clostridium cavendishii]SHK67947.1 Coenzyme PQQ synthesis protein D (PqqD) [Clostridium cavendishii DSM 21758]